MSYHGDSPPSGPWPTPQPPWGAPAPAAYATWVDRVVATLWDVLYLWPAYLLMVVGVVVLGVGIGLLAADGGGAAGILLTIVGSLLMVGGWVWALVRHVLNYVVDQGRTGYTWGKRKVGIRLIDERTGQPPGVGSCVGRYVLHLLINYFFLIDYLWPLWDPRVQTITDKVLTTVEIRQRPF